jgi:biopolymer transport protein ExbD
MSDINTTPLVDVMLVLLIIFLITVPVVIQTVPVQLPKVVFEPTTTKPENVALSVRAAPNGACEVYWGQTRVGAQELLDRAVAKLRREIDRQGGPTAPGLELPEAHIRGDVNTPYRCIGGAIYTMQRAGFARVGFISEPPAGFVSQRL